MPDPRKPNGLFEVWTADTVAECLDGVMGVPGLYAALWALVPKKRSYDIEDNGPADVIGIDCLADAWAELSLEHRRALNDLALRALHGV